MGEQLENSQHHLLFKSDNCLKLYETNTGTNAEAVSLLRIPTLCLSFCKFSINGLSSMGFHSVQKENLLRTYSGPLSTLCVGLMGLSILLAFSLQKQNRNVFNR